MEKLTDEYIDDLIKKLVAVSPSHSVFSEFCRVYPFTNECIAGYLKYVDFHNKRSALSVLSSGDHAFSLITKGITDIDTFDVNGLTEYYALGLKKSMIMKYSYYDFLNLAEAFNYQMGFSKMPKEIVGFDFDEDILKQIIFDVSGEMDERYRSFWRKIVDSSDTLCSKDNKYIIGSIANSACRRLNFNIDYLKNEQSYNLLRSRLNKVNISFTRTDISSVPDIFKDKKYDIVLLSNVLDFVTTSFGQDWGIDKLQEFTNPLEELCNPDSIIFLHYLLPWRYVSSVTNCRALFLGSTVHTWDLDDYRVYPLDKCITEQGVLLKKIRKN